jgi:hypothetical protein
VAQGPTSVNSQSIAAIAVLLLGPLTAAAQYAPPAGILTPGPPLPVPPMLADEALPEATALQPALAMPQPQQPGVVFAPYPGKSPCGEFDSPYNNYFGDTRTVRSVVLGRLWTEMEYLAWASKSTRLPPLVSTSPLGTDPGEAGVLGAGGSLLFGDETTQNKLRSGARLNFGYWFTPEHITGVETRLLWLDGDKIDFNAIGGDDLILATPFIDADTGLNDAVLISYPELQDGEARVRSNMQLFGIEVLGRHMLSLEQCSRLDVIAGWRYLRLEDNFRADSIFLSLDEGSGFEPDTIVARTDGFRTKNDFHGGEFGLVYRWWNCCWALNLTGKVALGGTRTVASINGTTTAISPTDDVTVTAGGVLAQPSNIGEHIRNDFAAVGDIGVKLEYAFTPQLRLTLGYNWMSWSSVARIGDQIDTTVDPSQIAPDSNPEATRPGFAFRPTSFWSHGLTFGGYYDF